MGKIYIVYKIVNTINNKPYIGKTCSSIQDRWNHHVASSVRGDGYYLHRAIKKYGKECFNIIPIYNTKDQTHINPMERYFIREYDSYRNGYNLTMGGEGNYGWNPSEKTRKIWSKQRQGAIHTDEHIQKRCQSLIGQKRTPTQVERIRNSKLGVGRNKFPNKWIINLSLAQRRRSPYYMITFPDGSITIIHGLKDFCENNNLSTSCLSNVVAGRRRRHKQFKCRKLNNDIKI